MVQAHRGSPRRGSVSLLSLTSWLWLAALLPACGVGDRVLLGRFRQGAADAEVDDGGNPFPDGGDGGLAPPDAGADDATSGPACQVPAELTPIPCTTLPPEGASLPRVEWRFPPPSLELSADSRPGTPLVANLTDDNGDGRVDLCDVPDIVLTTGTNTQTALWILAGDSGKVEQLVDRRLLPKISPAIGDLDADGVPEIVSIDSGGLLVALRPDGSPLWQGSRVSLPLGIIAACYAISIYDLEGDGSPEILVGFEAFDAKGSRRLGVSGAQIALFDSCLAPIAADLDGDQQLEMLFGHEVVRASGKSMWTHQSGQIPSIPVVANLDGDPEPEVVLTSPSTVYVVEATTGAPIASLARNCGGAPPSVHDFDGDGIDELAFPSCADMTRTSVYALRGANLELRWSVDNMMINGGASGVAGFDFMGRGSADLMYADERAAALYAGGDGRLLFEGLRLGKQVPGSPVIADVDNDGSAEILVPAFEAGERAVLTVVGVDAPGWMAARRIWNQHAYHVTNVHEDGRIPKGPADAPRVPSRMRSNATREKNRLCTPP
jgi:hypothetical protein